MSQPVHMPAEIQQGPDGVIYVSRSAEPGWFNVIYRIKNTIGVDHIKESSAKRAEQAVERKIRFSKGSTHEQAPTN